MNKLLLVACIYSTLSFGTTIDCDKKLNLCDNAYRGCKELVVQQDASIKALKDYSKTLENKLTKDDAPTLPAWAWVAIGAVAGGLVITVIK